MSTDATALALQQSGDYSQQQIDLLINHICKGFSPVETDFFMNVAKRVNLDPFKRQIYAMPRFEGKGQYRKQTMVIMTSIEGLRAIASRCKTAEGSDAYAGNDKPVFTWLEGDEKTKDFPYSAECTVWRIVGGERRAFTAEVFFDECVQEKQIYENDKATGKWEPNSMWNQRPKGQLGKCAEAAALRKGFPEETAGLYIDEEAPNSDQQQAPNQAKERPVHTSESVRQEHHEPEAREADAEVVEKPKREPWVDLMKDDKWKDVTMAEGMPYEGETIVMIAKGAKKLTEAWQRVPTGTIQRAALHAEQWARTERYLASQSLNVVQVEELLKSAGLMDPEASVFDTPGAKLPELYKQIVKVIREREQSPPQQAE